MSILYAIECARVIPICVCISVEAMNERDIISTKYLKCMYPELSTKPYLEI